MSYLSSKSAVIALSIVISAFITPFRASAQSWVPAKALGTIEYEVRYKIMGIDTKVATATISLEKGNWEQQPALHSHAVIRANSVFKLFMKAEYIADAYLSPDGQKPLYFINPTEKGDKAGKFECKYDNKGGTIRSEVVRPPADPVSSSFSLDGRTMDLLSLLVHIRFLDMAPGASRQMHLLMSGNSIAATLTCQGIDKERFPGTETKRFHLKMRGRGLMENGSGDEIDVWCTTGSDHRLLGLETILNSSPMVVTVQ